MFNLIIVESPAKCSKIEHILSSYYHDQKFEVVATKGHIMEIKNPGLNIDIENDFKPVYVYKNNNQINRLKILSASAKEIYIATDLDYSGSFIGYCVCLLLNLNIKTTKRLIFNSITETAIIKAFENPTTLDLNHVYYEKTRQIIDRLIGFKLTSCAYKYLQSKNNSIGRCQTIALKMVDDKEKEINDFIVNEFENNDNVYKPKNSFYKMVVKFDKNEIFDPDLIGTNDKLTFENVQQFLNNKDKLKFTLTDIKKVKKSSEPPKPFITSTIQQTAARLFNYSIETIMRILQTLYEKGLITYIRTDCPIISEDFKKIIKQYIQQEYNEKYVNLNNRETIKEHSQNGHEAIRITNFNSNISMLSNQEINIYNLIKQNTLQSQMSDYEYHLSTLTISNNINDIKLTSNIHTLIFDGFKILDKKTETELTNNQLNDYHKNKELNFKNVDFIYSVNSAPVRYNEQKIIKQLDKLGIGRPSTFATFTKKIKERDYVESNNINGIKILCTNYQINENRKVTKTEKLETFFNENNKFQPTDRGMKIMNFTNTCFNNFINYDYTAQMEKQLDKIANGEIGYLTVLNNFWNSFNKQLKEFDGFMKTNKNKKMVKEFKHNNQKYLLKSGVYGYYVTVDGKNKTLKGLNKEFQDITINDILDLIENKKGNNSDDLGIYKDKNIKLCSGKFGYYFIYDNKNYSLKNYKIDKSTIENDREGVLKICIMEIESFMKILDYKNYEFVVKHDPNQNHYYVNVFTTSKDKKSFTKSLRITKKDLKILNDEINNITPDFIMNKLFNL